MTRLRILPLFVLVIAILLLAMGFMIVKTYEERVGVPTPTITQEPAPPVRLSGFSWIRIDPIGNKTEGDVFTITSTTNLSAGDKIHIEIYPAQYHHAMKNSPVEFSGCTDTVRVIPGQNGTNTNSFTVHSSACTNLISMEYTITETVILDGTTGEARFNITPKTQPPLNQSSDPLWIKIDPISDKQVGDVFTITSTTNFSAGSDILVEVYIPRRMFGNQPFSGATGQVKVMPGTNGTNTTSFVVNTSTFAADIYAVYETEIVTGTTNSTLFYVIPENVPSGEPAPKNYIDWGALGLPPLKVNTSMLPEYPHFGSIDVLNGSEPGSFPTGTIIVFSPDGIARFFDKNGTQFASYYDSPSLHGMTVPSGAVINRRIGNVTSVYLDGRRIATEIYETGGH